MTRVVTEYSADYLETVTVRQIALRPVVTVGAAQSLAEVRRWLESGAEGTGHQGFPVLDGARAIVGVVTWRDLGRLDLSGDRTIADALRRPAVVIDADRSLREAADLMVQERIGRLPVVAREAPGRVVGILTRSDLLQAHQTRLDDARPPAVGFGMRAEAETG